MARRARMGDDIVRLHDLAQERGIQGFDYRDGDAFGWARAYFYRVVRNLRRRLKDGPATLTCYPTGRGTPWRYVLTEEADEDVRWWQVNRLVDEAARNATQCCVASSMLQRVDPRSAEGMLARLIYNEQVHVGQLIGQMQELLRGGGPSSPGAAGVGGPRPAGGPSRGGAVVNG